MEYFKTDGIRMNANQLIFSLIPLKLGRILGEESKKVCVGFDTRVSSNEIYDLLVTGLVTRGCDVVSLGVCPTSLVGYVTKKENCNYGIMITASHNPYFDNGIKVFSKEGKKLTRLEEEEIEELLKKEINYPLIKELGKVEDKSSYYRFKYIEYLKSLIKPNIDENILIDCSNGVLSEIVEKVFENAKVNIICNHPDGKNINYLCGSEHLENVKNKMMEGYSLGVSFDGDGDRLVLIKNDGSIIQGDDFLYLFVREYNYSKIVTTPMSNIGLEEKLKEEGKEVYYSGVGDKKVYELMNRENILLGGESSGHIIFENALVKNDSLFTLIKYLNLENKEINYKKYYNQTFNVLLKNKNYNQIDFNKLEKKINDKVQEKGRAFVRKSGTEEVLRINVQLKEERLIEEVKAILRKEFLDNDEL